MLGITRETSNSGIYLGRVVKVDGRTAYVEVPRLAPGFDYPARYPAGSLAQGRQDAGTEVAVAFLEGGRDELVVLLRLA